MRTIWAGAIPRTTNPLRFFIFASRPHWRAAALASLFVIGASILNAYVPYLYKMIADSALNITNAQDDLYRAAFIYVGISLASVILWRASGFAGMFWATGTRATAREALATHVTLHSHQYFSDRFAGGLLSKVKQGADGAKDFVESFLWQFLRFVVSLIASFVIVFSTSPIIGYLLLALFLVIIPYNYYFARKRVPRSMAAQNAETALNGATVDTLTNISSVHEFAQRDFEVERLRGFTLERRIMGIRNWRYGEFVLLGNGILQTLFMGAMIGVAVYLAAHGQITPGDIILFLGMLFLLEDQLTFMANQFNRFSEMWGQVKDSLEDIVQPHDVADRAGAKQLAGGGTISFENVFFTYGGVQVFEDLSFTIPAGQRVGLVGRSGAGKSTLVKLLLRHYDLQEGAIRINDQDIAGVTKNSLRSSIAVVPQEPALFHRTIHENIAYSRPTATRADVIEAARKAQAHEFIETLPDGYESLVGERGIKLSGGQRQRIAIARALLKDAPILLLDEATSALDSESEILVQQALLALMENRTVIAIAHRLSTLRAMDRIIVFNEGKIIEDGTHEELLKAKGSYAELWSHQAGGFLED